LTTQTPSASLQDYLRLMRLDRPVGTLLLLWPTLAALVMAADGVPPLTLIVIFTVGTFTMRSAGCVINDYADRNVDGAVKRTKDRPLVTGAINEQQALRLFIGLVAGSGVLILFLNTTTQLLAVVGLGLAVIYPFMKRHTHLPQVVLGAAFSWGILMAWSAQGLGVPREAGLLFVGSLFWIVAYDTEYAMVDRDDDLIVGIKSTAILFGDLDRLMICVLQSLALGTWFLLGVSLDYQNAFFIGLIVATGLFAYQQYLIRDRSREGCSKWRWGRADDIPSFAHKTEHAYPRDGASAALVGSLYGSADLCHRDSPLRLKHRRDTSAGRRHVLTWRILYAGHRPWCG
jgi:4-hydroxybenzoate polyprenyltransferase